MIFKNHLIGQKRTIILAVMVAPFVAVISIPFTGSNFRSLAAIAPFGTNVAARVTVPFVGAPPTPTPTPTLIPSPDGLTVHDTVNNISWLANANSPASNRFGLPVGTGPGTQICVNTSGSMRYDAAVAWVAAMNAANY